MTKSRKEITLKSKMEKGYTPEVSMDVHKDGAIAFSSNHAENFIYLYPDMVKKASKHFPNDYKLAFNSAHDTAQWMMDANRRQVERVKRIIAYLDEIENVEKENWKTGAAMATNAESRDEIMARAKGRIDMAKRLREIVFPSPVVNKKSDDGEK